MTPQIPHPVMQIMARTFEKMGVDMKAVREIATANFNLFDLSLWRTIIQDPEVSGAIVWNFIETPQGREFFAKMRESFDEIIHMSSKQELIESLKSTYKNLGGEELGPGMNRKTTTVLERLANLGMKSFSFSTEDDNPGSLVQKLQPIAEKGVNITAADSHRGKGQIRFDIGIDPKTSKETLEAIFSKLESLGCTITEKPS